MTDRGSAAHTRVMTSGLILFFTGTVRADDLPREVDALRPSDVTAGGRVARGARAGERGSSRRAASGRGSGNVAPASRWSGLTAARGTAGGSGRDARAGSPCRGTKPPT